MKATTLTVAITSLLMLMFNVDYLSLSYSKIRDTAYFLTAIPSHAGTIFFCGGSCVLFFSLFDRQKKARSN